MTSYQSWGRYPRVSHERLGWPDRFRDIPALDKSVLPYGFGRSYGDSCLNPDNCIITTAGLDRLIAFNPESGVLRCESGLSLEEILRFCIPQGWFLPVSPGTKFVTVGGALANDIHGKNHHCDGTFGHHVIAFELLRSSGDLLSCSRNSHQELFFATIGGLGLTGLITTVELKLKRISSVFIEQQIIKFASLEEFFHLSAEAEKNFTYTVSWIDCLAKGSHLGRGLFISGNHADSSVDRNLTQLHRRPNKVVPVDFPGWALNPLSVRLFNFAYYHKQMRKEVRGLTHYDPFFYPLDSIHYWNRIYGKQGFLQWQCVVPFSEGPELMREILTRIAKSGMASFLAVLKTFGKIPSEGLLSFPREGVTLALDFPNKGKALFDLLDELDLIVIRGKGAVYAAKDARMKATSFKQFYPRWEQFQAYIDPKFSSGFWRRMMEKTL